MFWSLKMDMIMDNVIVFTCNIVSELCDGAVNDLVVSLFLFQSSSVLGKKSQLSIATYYKQC